MVAGLNRVRCVATVILICLLSAGIWFSSVSTFAQSQAYLSGVTNITYVSLYNPVSGGVVKGFVLDEDGNPVSNAVVTLWQDGHIWMEGKRLSGCTNPQRTWPYDDEGIYYQRSDGEFSFVFVNQGSFIVTAEKEGYKASAIVYVTNDPSNSTFNDTLSPPVTLTLDSYHIPSFSPEQLSYTGAVAGTLRNDMGVRLGSVNVSLWQDGKMIVMPGNPQLPQLRNVSGQEVDYLFEHLAPGQYQVIAEYWWGGKYNESVMVNVDDRLEIVNIPLSQFYAHPLITPTLSPVSSPAPAAMPSWSMAMILSSIAIALLVYKARKPE